MEDITIEEVKSRLHKLFLFYASYGQRSNQNQLKSGKFIKLMQDAEIIDANITKKKLDLIFCSENKHRPNATFQTFLEIVARVAREKYNEAYSQQPFEALKALLQQHLFPLYEALKQQQEIESFDQEKFQLDEDSIKLIRSVLPVLDKLYQVYFPWELSSSETMEVIQNRSNKTFMAFIMSFDLVPSLVSKAVVYKLWQELVIMSQSNPQAVLPQEDVGYVFKFSIFVEILVRIAILGYEEGMSTELLPSERIALLLERMEMSKGFQDVEKLTHRTHTNKTSLLPPKKMMEQISRDLEQSHMSIASLQQESQQQDISALSLDQNGLIILEKYVDRLHRIFQAYCSFGEPLNTTRLKSSKLVKLLRDAGLVKEKVLESQPVSIRATPQPSMRQGERRALSLVDADLIFVKLTGTANSKNRQSRQNLKPINHLSLQNTNHLGRMEFQQFLKALELISSKLYPETSLEEGFVFLIEEFLLPLEAKCLEKGIGNLKIINMLEQLQDQNVIECLSLVHKSVSSFFRHYADTRGFMNLANFVKFCKDFEIFPDILSKGKLLEQFYTLASIQASTELPSTSIHSQKGEKAPEQTEQELIDEHLFVEALALLSFEVQHQDPQPSNIEKICYLLERMAQSEGPHIVQRMTGSTRAGQDQIDFLALLRNKYPEIFFKPEPQPPPSFEQMLAM